MKAETLIPPTEAPRTRKELGSYAYEVATRLMNWYEKHQEFRDETDEGKDRTGLIYRCAGSVSLLLLANTFPEVAREPRWRNIVLTEFEKVRTHIRDKGFDASPFIDSEKTRESFSPAAKTQYHYTDSVTWALSFAILMRLAHRADLIKMDLPLFQSITEMIRNTLQILHDIACEKGGWGFTSNCSQPDLYYSYAASEALADFGDYVLGESKEEGIAEPDEELMNALGTDLIAKVQDARKRTCQWLIQEYMDKLSSELVTPPNFKPGAQDHILLYPTYFVIDMLIVSNADQLFPESADRILEKIEHAIYLTRIRFDLAREDKVWWENANESSYTLEWEKRHPAVPKTKFKNPSEPGLVPLSLRCNTLYTYYMSLGKDKKIDDLFGIVNNELNPENGLWDRQGFSLMVTERAIEAIVDYMDYLNKFPDLEEESKSLKAERSFREAVETAVRDYLGSPGGAELLVSAQGPSSSIPGSGVVMSEEALANLLNSLFAKGSKVLRGESDPKLTPKTYEKLQRQFHDFLLELLAGEIMKRRGAAQLTRDNLISLLEKKEEELLGSLKLWLSKNDKVNLGDLFDEVVADALDRMAKGRTS